MPDTKALSEPQKALRKLGLARDIDLALHLPLRYEDETRIIRLRDAREGDTAQIEATVTACEIVYRPRRQLLVTVDDGSDTCVLRFFSFYPSQQKALAVGNRLRLRGELKGGFLGWQMVHPTYKAAGGELPAALTPVYSTVASLPQAYLRKAVLGALARADLSDTFPPGVSETLQPLVWSCAKRWSFCTSPTPDVPLAALEDRSHPAWQRLKAEELLAQQLSQLESKRERAALRSPALRCRARVGCKSSCCRRCRFSSRRPSGAWSRRLRKTWPAPCRCTGCCRATSGRARPWWPRSLPQSPSATAGNAR